MKEIADKVASTLDSSSSSQRSGATIALFGEVLADVFPDRSVLGGAPFNVARHLKAFGLNPVLITRTGNDALRAELMETMSRLGMSTIGVQCDQHYPTGQVKVHFEGGTHRFEILPEQAYDHIHASVARMVALSIHPELVYFGTLAQRHAVSRGALKTLLAHSNVPTFFDVNLRSPWYDEQLLRSSLQQADIVKLNDEEVSVMAKLLSLPGNTLAEQARAFSQTFEIGQVLVTCGAEGAWLVQREGADVSMMPQGSQITVVDTVGAGDGFSSVFLLGKVRGWPLEQTLARAHEFAAAICCIRGAAPEQSEFYEPFLKVWQS